MNVHVAKKDKTDNAKDNFWGTIACTEPIPPVPEGNFLRRLQHKSLQGKKLKEQQSGIRVYTKLVMIMELYCITTLDFSNEKTQSDWSYLDI
jgi:hypothetical protein